jgi:hypothetical protein
LNTWQQSYLLAKSWDAKSVNAWPSKAIYLSDFRAALPSLKPGQSEAETEGIQHAGKPKDARNPK